MDKKILLILLNIYIFIYNFNINVYAESANNTEAVTTIAPPVLSQTPLIQAAIANKNELISISGNYASGDTDNRVIVVFYDYNCQYSQELFEMLTNELSKTSENYKIIYKPVGMMDEVTSRLAAELAVAANDPSINKFQELHNALVNSGITLPYTIDDIKVILRNLNISYDNLVQLVRDNNLGDIILRNHVIYDRIQLPGVPGIIAVKLDDNLNVLDNKIYYIAGTDSHQLEISLFNLRI